MPDIPGVYFCGDSIEHAMWNVRDALIGHLKTLLELGEPVQVTLGNFEELRMAPEHADGMWAMVELDLTQFDSRPQRISVRLLRCLLSELDRHAAARKQTRSEVLAWAVLQLMD